MFMPGPEIVLFKANKNSKMVLSDATGGPEAVRTPVLITPLVETPDMVSFRVTQLKVPMDGSNC